MLGGISGEELTGIVASHVGRAPLPAAFDQAVRDRAVRVARRQGLPERIEAELAADEPLDVIKHSTFRLFARTGNRSVCDGQMHRRSRQINLAAMGVYLGMNGCAEYLQDLLWAECDSAFWTLSSHENPAAPIDLRVAMCGFHYGLIVKMLQLDGEVTRRVLGEVRRRVLDVYLDPRHSHWWKTHTNNWNAVCNGAVGLTAMLIERDPKRLTAILRSVLADLPVFLSGFTADGGCTEGPGYWRFGFGWYADFAAGLYDFTEGRINLMDGEKVARICRYPLGVWVAPGQDLAFADAHDGFMPAALAARINRFVDVPELFGMCRLTGDGQLAVAALADLLAIDEATHEPLADPADHLLPDLAVAKVRAGRVTVGAKAGHNAEHHNHNDVGSFVVHRGATFFLTDLGAPVYSRKTFSDRRYESLFCNSLGHSVPVINGLGQPAGATFAGTLETDGLNEGGARTLRIEMAGAYDDESLMRLTRVIEIPPDGQEIRLTDTFGFSAAPESVQEVFITTLPAEAAGDGKSVRIRSDADGEAELAAVEIDGTFAVAERPDESAEHRRGELIRRITFTPAAPLAEMTLRFAVRFV